jgi:hypothetical protein
LVISVTEDFAMAKKTSEPRFKVGDRVRILHAGWDPGPIVELRGPLGPGGAQVYRVRYRGKPRPAYVEVLEDQLVLVSEEDNPSSGS